MLDRWKAMLCGSSSSGTPGCSFSPVPAAVQSRVFQIIGMLRVAGSALNLCSFVPLWTRKRPANGIGRAAWWAGGALGAHNPMTLIERLPHSSNAGGVALLVTQNVDRLHQAAGSANVVDLHGRLDLVRCMGCEQRIPREELQQELLARNPSWTDFDARDAPDGDADLEGLDFSTFAVPACASCGGLLKPDVVFYGESVPRERVDVAMQGVRDADAMLVVGSSLMVFSGYRFAREAAAAGKPVASLNLGRTRADDLLSLKVAQSCGAALAFLLEDARVA